MKTVKDLKEWLNQFPDETEVFFAKQEKPTGYESWGPVNFTEPDLTPLSENYGFGDTWEFSDWRNEAYNKSQSFGKSFLYIGSRD